MNEQALAIQPSPEPEPEKTGFLDRTLRKLKNAWQNIAGASYDATQAGSRPDLPAADLESLRQQMQDCLQSRGGEVSARARAAALGHVYLALDAKGRERFLGVLAHEFDVDPARVDAAIEDLSLAGDDDARRDYQALLRKALEAPRIKLLTQFNALPDGVKFLVDMRADLLALKSGDSAIRGLEQDLKSLLTTWFDVDFLELRQITWDNAPAALLEKLIAYEAVHAIDGWDDLKNRLDSDRRCFAYFHPRMPHEPLIFVEVALVNGLADNIQALLDENAPVQDPGTTDTAIFYSISNAQKGLAGISFGNFLIKRVAATLSAEFKGLKTFATLSPVPGFMAWLEKKLAEGDPALLSHADRRALSAAAGRQGGGKGSLKSLLAIPGWQDDQAISEALWGPLMRLAARYLINEKDLNKRALDPVAHFHLTNGASMESLNWKADSSPRGLGNSAGIMINYLYDLNRIEDNHEAYTSTGKINASSRMRPLLKD
ncbi:MAG: malonyl-CoA decarboxylase [Rhodospirillaceae bacterium]|jgi:malonyl-CoA decarboxylase|nr:malonyl-CoA decarboxylase [Rhodospirillaceae bacterium]|tara:strand:- start:3116 stop:4579 length:1464 start_codon:yes stop_codon:yes gene_type:complete